MSDVTKTSNNMIYKCIAITQRVLYSIYQGGGKVLSPWNTSPELPSGWVGVPAKMCYYLRVITQGIFKENGDKRLEISTIPGIF